MLDNLDAELGKNVKFAYLFGSQATGNVTSLSDVDIAVYLDDAANNLDKHLEIHHALSKRLQRDVDLVVLNNVKNFNLLESIFSNGRVIADRDADFRKAFEVQKQHQILDYKAFKRYLDAG
jgi:predicted nucleotidyltransferase